MYIFNCKLKLQWYIFIVIYKWKRMLLQNIDTASVLLYALFIMSSMLHTDSVIVVNQTLSLIGTLRLPNECQVLIA